MNKIYEDLLKEADIRITSNRLLVLKTLQEKMHGAFSLLDVESALPYMDSLHPNTVRPTACVGQKRPSGT